MHLVRGMTSLNTRKRKAKGNNKRLAQAKLDHEQYLAKLGVKGNVKDYRYDIPDYKTGPRMTSDKIAGNGNKKEAKRYSGTEILGIATLHKSNAVPVRKDSTDAIDISRMRR